MRMTGLLLSALAVLAGCRSTPATQSAQPGAAASGAPVRALRYRTYQGNAFMGAMHGGGNMVDELWFPDRKVRARMIPGRRDWEAEVWVPTLDAGYGPIGNDQRGVMFSSNQVEPTETIWVPWDVAELIFAVADQQAALAAQREAAGRAADSLFRPSEAPQASSP